MTEEQELVVKYLIKHGCQISDRPNPKGYITFRPIGASSYGGCVFQNGTVHIKNEHTEPFEETTTHYATIAREVMGAAKFSMYWRNYVKERDLDTYEKLRKNVLEKAAEIKVDLDTEPTPVATQTYLLRDMLTPRESRDDFILAMSKGDLKIVDMDDVLKLLRNPPPGWMARYNDLKAAKRQEDYDILKGVIKSQTPAIVQVEEEPSHRIVWLDVDAKENDAARFDTIIREMMDNDDRVASVFHTIGGGIAVGMGLHARTQLEYIAGMKRISADIERDYGLTIDKSCWRWQQLRLLSYDPDARIKANVRHYRSNTMNFEELQQLSDKITAKIESTSGKLAKRTYRAADSMLEELEYARDHLGISVIEDVWTGKRTYMLKGKEVDKIDSLWLAVKDLELRDNNNCWRIAKDDAIGYLTADGATKRDIVMESVFNREWDGQDRWPQLLCALHLDQFSLEAFQMWMRQGIGLLENSGRADDLQRNFMLILYSRNQSIGKSHLVRAMSCGTNSFTQKNLDIRSKDTLADLYSHWIHEFGELGTTFRRKDINDLKNYVTNTAIAIRRPYDRDATTYPVRTSIIGTTNDADLFTDDTGNRRYVVIDCRWSRDDWPAIDAIDFMELWRQAKAEYEIERHDKKGLYPYVMSATFQAENDVRCKTKTVRTKEMYALAQVFASWTEGSTDAIERGEDEVFVSMAKLLAQFETWGVRNMNEYNLKRAFKTLGFDEYATAADTVFVINADDYEKLRRGASAPLSKTKEQALVRLGAENIGDVPLQRVDTWKPTPKPKKNEEPVIVSF